MGKTKKSALVPATRVKGKSSLDSSGRARRVSWVDMKDKKDTKKVQKKRQAEKRPHEDQQGEREGSSESKAKGAGKEERA